MMDCYPNYDEFNKLLDTLRNQEGFTVIYEVNGCIRTIEILYNDKNLYGFTVSSIHDKSFINSIEKLIYLTKVEWVRKGYIK